MARIPEGVRTLSGVKAINAGVLPRKRFQASGFNVKEGTYRPVKRNFRSELAAMMNRK